MGRIVTAYQPHYYPRLHYLARAQQADVFVVYDDVQFSRGSPQHRAPVQYYDKERLVAPVQRMGRDTRIDEARLDLSERWPSAHLQTLQGKYGDAAAELSPFYKEICAKVIDVEHLRENREAVAELAGGRVGEKLVKRCTRLDARWREKRAELDDLRERKAAIETRIADRKRENPLADIGELVAEVEEVNERLTEPEAAAERLRERRDRALVSLSELLESNDEANANDVEWVSLDELWSLAGITADELMADVKLVDLTIPLLEELLERFDVTSTVVRSSELDVEHPGDASVYLARMTEVLDGDGYLSGGVGYENYLDEGPFDERGIDVLVQDWEPTWEGGNVCSLDVLFGSDDPGRYIR